MVSVIEGMRQIIGVPSFQNADVLEYLVASILVCIVVSSVFKILVRWFDR